MKQPLGQVEAELLNVLSPEWQSFKTILWEFNGPRELTVQQNNLQASLTRLCRKKIIERKNGAKGSGNGSIADAGALYRLREAA